MDPAGPYFGQGQGPLKSISGPNWGSMKVNEGPMVHIKVPGYQKSCYQ